MRACCVCVRRGTGTRLHAQARWQCTLCSAAGCKPPLLSHACRARPPACLQGIKDDLHTLIKWQQRATGVAMAVGAFVTFAVRHNIAHIFGA